MGRPSTARQQLVESAADLFHERGFHPVGVSEICAAAGVQKGSFYHFFDSKQALGLAVIEAYSKAMTEGWERLSAADGEPLDRLDAFLAELHRQHREECEEGGTMLGCPLGNLALELATHDPEMRDALRASLDRQVAAFERLLREARDRGDIDPRTDPGEAAQAVVALVEGKLLLAKLRNDAAPLEGVGVEALRLVGARSG